MSVLAVWVGRWVESIDDKEEIGKLGGNIGGKVGSSLRGSF